jgi:hypothetical protein
VPVTQPVRSRAKPPRASPRGETFIPVLGFPYSRLLVANLASPVCGRVGVETSRAELGSLTQRAELSSARPFDELGKAARLGSTRSGLASRLAEPTSLDINVNMLSKL